MSGEVADFNMHAMAANLTLPEILDALDKIKYKVTDEELEESRKALPAVVATLRQCLKQRDHLFEVVEDMGFEFTSNKADYDAELMAILRAR